MVSPFVLAIVKPMKQSLFISLIIQSISTSGAEQTGFYRFFMCIKYMPAGFALIFSKPCVCFQKMHFFCIDRYMI